MQQGTGIDERQAGIDAAPALRFGRLHIDPNSRMVRVDGEEKALTSYQFDLIVALAENAGRVSWRRGVAVAAVRRGRRDRRGRCRAGQTDARTDQAECANGQESLPG